VSTAALVSIAEYLANPGVPEAEYIDGVLRPRSMPTGLHSIIQFLLQVMLRRQGVKALGEVSIRPTKTRFLIPDLVADKNIQLPYPERPVSLCVEILSPEDRIGAMLAKCEEFHAWGSPYCWVIDPVGRRAWEFHAGGVPEKFDRNGTLRAGDLRISLEELFSAMEAEAG
jgi:Uma2 family endonuclease